MTIGSTKKIIATIIVVIMMLGITTPTFAAKKMGFNLRETLGVAKDFIKETASTLKNNSGKDLFNFSIPTANENGQGSNLLNNITKDLLNIGSGFNILTGIFSNTKGEEKKETETKKVSLLDTFKNILKKDDNEAGIAGAVAELDKNNGSLFGRLTEGIKSFFGSIFKKEDTTENKEANVNEDTAGEEEIEENVEKVEKVTNSRYDYTISPSVKEILGNFTDEQYKLFITVVYNEAQGDEKLAKYVAATLINHLEYYRGFYKNYYKKEEIILDDAIKYACKGIYANFETAYNCAATRNAVQYALNGNDPTANIKNLQGGQGAINWHNTYNSYDPWIGTGKVEYYVDGDGVIRALRLGTTIENNMYFTATSPVGEKGVNLLTLQK